MIPVKSTESLRLPLKRLRGVSGKHVGERSSRAGAAGRSRGERTAGGAGRELFGSRIRLDIKEPS
jgi:hypothetical protein